MPGIKQTLTEVFNIRPGEGLATVLLLLHSFFIGISSIFLATASYALFLSKNPVNTLPYVYIISAVIIAVFGLFFSKLQERVSFSKLLIMTVTGLLLAIGALYVCMALKVSDAVIMALIVLKYLLAVLTGLEFWGLAGRIFNVRQGKRLFGLIGSGELVAAIIGGMSLPLLLKVMDTADLLLISWFGMAACLVTLLITIRNFPQINLVSPEDAKSEKAANSGLFEGRYVVYLICSAALSIFGYYLLDYIFYGQVKLVKVNEEEIALFIGRFFAVFRFITLISNSFLYSRLITRFGLSVGLLTVPIVVAIGCIAAVLVDLGSDSAQIMFFIIVATKLFDAVTRVSIEDPSFRILYQPLPQRVRLKAQTVLETIVDPLTGAIAGLVLVLLTGELGWETIPLIYLTSGILIFWFVAAIVLRREYTGVLSKALTTRKLGGATLSLDDGSSISVLKQGLKSDKPGEVIYCINMLEEIEHEALASFLIDLTNHREPEVRAHAMERIGSLGLVHALAPVKKRLEIESDPKVIGYILRAICALTDAFDRVYPYMDDDRPEVRKGAMIGLLGFGGIDGVMAAGSKLNELLLSEQKKDRKFAAEILGEVKISGFYRPLIELMHDRDLEVRKAAIEASGNLKNTRLLPFLLENLSKPEVSTTTANSLVSMGKDILQQLEESFEDDASPRVIKTRLIRVIGRIGGSDAIQMLKQRIDYPDEDLRTAILSSLVSCRYMASGKDIRLIHELVLKEIEDAAWTLAALVDIGDYPYASELSGGLKNEVDKNRKRIFLLLAMVYPVNSVFRAQASLKSVSSEKRAYAVEVLDNMLSSEIKSQTLPLFDELAPAQCQSKLMVFFPQEHMSKHARIKEIIFRARKKTASWTIACALFAAGKIGTMEFYDVVVQSLGDSDPLIRETAVWAIGRISPVDLVNQIQVYSDDPSTQVAAVARSVISSVGVTGVPVSKGYMTRSGRYRPEMFVTILMDENENSERRCQAAVILGRLKGEKAGLSLLSALTIPDKRVRLAVLDALEKGDFDLGSARTQILGLITMEIEDAKSLVNFMAVLQGTHAADKLLESLEYEIQSNCRRILAALSLLNENEKESSQLKYWYLNQSKYPVPEGEQETLERWLNVLEARTVRDDVRVLFSFHNDWTALDENWRQTEETDNRAMELKDAVAAIAFSDPGYMGRWVRICALEAMVRLDVKAHVFQLAEILKTDDEIIRSHAAWALARLDKDMYDKISGQLKNDPSPLVAKTARQMAM